MDFKFVPKKNTQTQGELLQKLVLTLEKENNIDLANNLKQYIQKRDEYIKDYKEKYVQISSKGVKPLDITKLDDTDLGFNSKYEGLLLKVGSEIESDTHSLVSWSYNSPIPIYETTIGDGNNHKTNVSVVLDTGCQITTFDNQILAWIRNIAPNYPTTLASTTGIGGKIVVQQGLLVIIFCNRRYTIRVNYTDIPYSGLIGIDILNSGVLTLDSGTNGLFTFH